MTIDRKAAAPIRESALWQAYQRRRYAIVFFTLLATLLVMPVVTTLGLSGSFMRLLVGACLLAAVMPSATRRTRQLFLVAVLALVLAQFVPEDGGLSSLLAYVPVLIGLAGLAAAAGALGFAVSAKTVSSESIYAVLSTYLLAGVFFGEIYWSIESIHPGSVVGPDPFSEINATYFSFVTLATLGYGDFLPRTAITRGLATFEVIGGQLFLAVLVARLIGAFASEEPQE